LIVIEMASRVRLVRAESFMSKIATVTARPKSRAARPMNSHSLSTGMAPPVTRLRKSDPKMAKP
jgi:hypothetical protein